MRAPLKSNESSLHGGSTPSRDEIKKSLDDGLFEVISEHAHEQVSFRYDAQSGYRGIIAIHNTTLGPALGGTRFWNYENDRDALVDVLRLSRGMTYKAAVAGVPLGGGKSDIIGNNKTTEREANFRRMGGTSTPWAGATSRRKTWGRARAIWSTSAVKPSTSWGWPAGREIRPQSPRSACTGA